MPIHCCLKDHISLDKMVNYEKGFSIFYGRVSLELVYCKQKNIKLVLGFWLNIHNEEQVAANIIVISTN